MERDITVSVMITYYNQKQYIADSLGSVISQQTTFPVEIICGDDGSDDGTYEELLSWRERYPDRITVIRMPRDLDKKHEPIVRVSYNRYTMWQQAKGDYVSFLDGDDYYTDPHKLQRQVELLQAHPDCIGCCQPAMMVWDDDPEKNHALPGSRLSDSVLVVPAKEYWGDLYCHAETFLFRNSEAVKRDNVNPFYFDDPMIVCYFIKHGPLIYSPDNMTVYRQLPGSSWNGRTHLRQVITGACVYYESIRILGGGIGWNLFCFRHSYMVCREWYESRGRIDLSQEDPVFIDILCRHEFIRATLNYGNYGILKKLVYHLKYYIPTHSARLFFPYSLFIDHKYPDK